MSLPSLVFTLTSPAVKPSAGVVMTVCAQTGWAASAKPAPSVVVAASAVRRDSAVSLRETRSPSMISSRLVCGAKPMLAASSSTITIRRVSAGLDMRQGEILRTLHLHQSRHGALELEDAVALGVEL